MRRDCGITISLFLSVVVYFFILSSPSESQSDMESDNQSRGGPNAFALGIVCNIFTILFFASPLAKMVNKLKLGQIHCILYETILQFMVPKINGMIDYLF